MPMAKNELSPYTKAFFEDMEEGALRSARVVLPQLLDLLSPRSILDVGCGRGAWVLAAMELGVEDAYGVDGTYIDPDTLLIPRSHFQTADLSRPFEVPRQYDLALCLEVAEHLPKRAAASLVNSLTAASPAVLFSAAIPGQTGTHPINEQFPEFWYRLFSERDFVAVDAVRPRIAWDARVEPWYAQNILLYVSRDWLEAEAPLRDYQPIRDPDRLLPWIHSEIWRGRLTWRGCLSLFRIVLARSFGQK
jgi:SAM-dependent methyltransferase